MHNNANILTDSVSKKTGRYMQHFTLTRNFADLFLKNDPFFLISWIRASHWKIHSSSRKRVRTWMYALRWRQNGRDNVSNHQPRDCLLNRLFRRRSKKTSKLRVTGLCAGNSPGTGEFPAQMASYAENYSIWWRYHAVWSVGVAEPGIQHSENKRNRWVPKVNV